MTITNFEVEAAKREAALDRAHEMCISKIKSLDAEYRAMAAANKKLAAENERLKGEHKTEIEELKVEYELDFERYVKGEDNYPR